MRQRLERAFFHLCWMMFDPLAACLYLCAVLWDVQQLCPLVLLLPPALGPYAGLMSLKAELLLGPLS